MKIQIRHGIIALMLVAGIALSLSSARATNLEGSATATLEASPDAYGGKLVKDVLYTDSARSAPGETMALVRYTIPAGAALPVHKHPGVQMASVESGTLTYHVLEGGTVNVVRADGTKASYGPGSTVKFTTGDSWEEPEGMVHYAENLTDQPVVLISTSLLATDQNATILVDLGTPTASPAATPAG